MTKPKMEDHECTICRKRLSDRAGLAQHVQLHSSEKPFSCPLCAYVCKTKKYLTAHTRKVHRKATGNACTVCGKKFHFKSLLEKHMYIHTNERPYKCEVCHKGFNSKYSLSSHNFIHSGAKPFKCQFCSYACRDSSTLRKHQERHSGVKRLYQCRACDKSYKTKMVLKVHVAQVHMDLDVKTKPCNECGKMFSSAKSLNNHVRILHRRLYACRCQVCGLALSNKYNMHSHLTTHVDYRPYRCSFEGCTKRYKDKATLKKHTIIHYPERQCACDVCGKRFTRPHRMLAHKKQHQVKRKCVFCDYCGKGFYNKNYVRAHITRKHLHRQRYECALCGLLTYNKPSIVMHLKYGHVSEADRQCRICKKTYKRHIYLKLHYWKTHCIKYKMNKHTLRKPKKRKDCITEEDPPDFKELELLHEIKVEALSDLEQDAKDSPEYSKSGHFVGASEVIEPDAKKFEDFYIEHIIMPSSVRNDEDTPKQDSDVDVDVQSQREAEEVKRVLLDQWRRKAGLRDKRRAKRLYRDEITNGELYQIKKEKIDVNLLSEADAPIKELKSQGKKINRNKPGNNTRTASAKDHKFDNKDNKEVNKMPCVNTKDLPPVVDREVIDKVEEEISITDIARTNDNLKIIVDPKPKVDKEFNDGSGTSNSPSLAIGELEINDPSPDDIDKGINSDFESINDDQEISMTLVEIHKEITFCDKQEQNSTEHVNGAATSSVEHDSIIDNDDTNTNHELGLKQTDEINTENNLAEETKRPPSKPRKRKCVRIIKADKNAAHNHEPSKETNNESTSTGADTENNKTDENETTNRRTIRRCVKNVKKYIDNDIAEDVINTELVAIKNNSEINRLEGKRGQASRDRKRRDINTDVEDDLASDEIDSGHVTEEVTTARRRRVKVARKNVHSDCDSQNDDDDDDYAPDDELEERNVTSSKFTINTHQCYVCYKLYETKEKLLDHCKEHFDVCNAKMLKKCPLCDYVTKLDLRRHIRLMHKINVNILYGTLKDRKNNNDKSRFYFNVENNKLNEIEVIPSIRNLNRQAFLKIDRRRREDNDRGLKKTKLVKKRGEWVVEKEAINTKAEKYVLPETVDEGISADDANTADDYTARMKRLYKVAKKNGQKMLFPCKECEKICQTMSALKLHMRRHDPNAKPFKKKVWKHKLTEEQLKKLSRKDEPKASENRYAKPKPIVNKHKCDPKLKDFYENNIKGGDVEFWQFLKIFNKMTRENVNDFADLENRPEFGIHYHNPDTNPPPDNILEGETSKVDKMAVVNKIGKLKYRFKRTIMISRKQYKARKAMQDALRKIIKNGVINT